MHCLALCSLFLGHDMKTITLGKTIYKTNRDDIMAAHAKCTGKHKIVKSKGAEKRFYPVYWPGDSTADYVATYEKLNSKIMPWDWAQLRAEPCLPAVGEDSMWEVTE
jgi:hypothetical protein